MTPDLPGPEPGDRGKVTPIGAGRATVSELRREVERLAEELALADGRRRNAERTLAGVARTAGAELAELRARVERLEAQLTDTVSERDGLRQELAARVLVVDGEPAPQPAKGRAGRRARRAALVAMLVAGVLLVADGLLTITWQEPVTAFLQARAQDGMDDDLAALEAEFAAAPAVAREDERRRLRRQALALLRNRDPGDPIARLEIPEIGLETVVVQSTRGDALRKGPGHYTGTVLPGMEGTVGIAGHRTTYGAPFREIDDLRKGHRLTLRMPYGTFTYRVTGSEIVKPSDASSLRSRAGTSKLVLTACHPLYSAAERIVVTARLQRAVPAAATSRS